jgi:hypothetical protein
MSMEDILGQLSKEGYDLDILLGVYLLKDKWEEEITWMSQSLHLTRGSIRKLEWHLMSLTKEVESGKKEKDGNVGGREARNSTEQLTAPGPALLVSKKVHAMMVQMTEKLGIKRVTVRAAIAIEP